MPDSPRILELRRRVQSDPASIAFAQLAEELRRAGANDEAVEVCRAGLARHPGYLSARVTLGRALIELHQLDEAHDALVTVASAAPDNLAAIRGLAEIHQRRGETVDALAYYRRALDLARHDPELEETVERMTKEIAPPAPEGDVEVEALFDFDRLVEQLGAEPPPEIPATISAGERSDSPPAHAWTDAADPSTGPDAPPEPREDPLADLERSLREHESQPTPLNVEADESTATPEAADAALTELEDWLQAIRDDRQ